jgi:hypothetical protein
MLLVLGGRRWGLWASAGPPATFADLTVRGSETTPNRDYLAFLISLSEVNALNLL